MAETSVTQALIDLHLEAADRGFGVPDLVAPPYYTLTPEFDPDDLDAPGWDGPPLNDPPDRITLQRALDRLWAQMDIGPGPLASVTTVQQALDDIWEAMNGTVVTIAFDAQEIPAYDPLLPFEYYSVEPTSVSGGGTATEPNPGYTVGGILPETFNVVSLPEPEGDWLIQYDGADLLEALVRFESDSLSRFGPAGPPRLSYFDTGFDEGFDAPYIAFFLSPSPTPYDWDGGTVTMRHIPYNP